MNAQENLIVACTLAIANLGPEEAYKRLRGGEGSGALTGLAAAKRADGTGRAEDREQRDRPQTLAVSPGLAEANKLRRLAASWKAMAGSFREKSWTSEQSGYHLKSAREMAMAETLSMCASDLLARLPKPESEQSENAGDGKPSQESVEASADPNHGTASGRRTPTAQRWAQLISENYDTRR